MERNYACIFTPSDTLVPHYLKILEAFTSNSDYESPFPDITKVDKEHLELYLKRVNIFSGFVHDLDLSNPNNPQNEFKIRGPFVTVLLSLGARIEDRSKSERYRSGSIMRHRSSTILRFGNVYLKNEPLQCRKAERQGI